jgi:formylglycine-generating enzyme required for sulfatase activity
LENHSVNKKTKLQLGVFLLWAMGNCACLAQKDGAPVAIAGGHKHPMAKDGVPHTVAIAPGSFVMGADAKVLPDAVIKGFGVMSDRPEHGDFDEVPSHKVEISHPFSISVTEVTPEEFRQFAPNYVAGSATPEYAAGVSWYQAQAYCEWLTRKTGKPWRLPTEAEWEYVARAGGKGIFGAGDSMSKPDVPNPYGVENMGVGRPEWVADWYAPYQPGLQVDPVGGASGYTKVVRGGGLDYRKTGGKDGPDLDVPAMSPYFARAANRASMAPAYASPSGNIGFRVVQAEALTTRATPPQTYFFRTAVVQGSRPAGGPEAAKPWFHTHELFPNLQGKSMPGVGWKLGIAPGIGVNYHNSAIQVLPNGDELAAYYNTPDREDDPDQTILIMRRRAGAEEWDMPEPWPMFADAALAGPVIWSDTRLPGKIWMFWGFPRLIGAGPFCYATSLDNGATWSQVQFPYFPKKIGRYVSQPINSVVRASDGTIYLPTDSTGKDADGNGSISAVWATRDEGKTWYDTGGRTAGRHTTIALAKNGDLLGFGGKNSNIDGRMPLARSKDGGQTWKKSKTPFDQLLSGERPSVIRLASGRLFFVADYNPKPEKHIHKDGAYVALSNDDGATWTIKRLPPDVLTVGYTTATQGSDGVIHVVTSKNKPDYEIELNEAWVLDARAYGDTSDTAIADGALIKNSAPGASWSYVRVPDGGPLLQGPEMFRYPDGKPMWSADFQAGRKVGEERYLRQDGKPIWVKHYGDDGTWTWENFDLSGKLVATSRWHGKTLLSSDIPDPVERKKAATKEAPEMDTP